MHDAVSQRTRTNMHIVLRHAAPTLAQSAGSRTGKVAQRAVMQSQSVSAAWEADRASSLKQTKRTNSTLVGVLRTVSTAIRVAGAMG